MSSKIVILSALLAVARAGNLLAASPVLAYESVGLAHPNYAVGSSHESTLRSLDGNSAVSHFSKSVDTAFSSVRKYDTRVTNDAKFLAPAASLAYAPYAAAYAPASAPIGYHAPAEYIPAYAAAHPAGHVVAHTSFTGLGAAYAF